LTAQRQQQRRAFVPLPEEDDAAHGDAMVASTPDPEAVSISRDQGRALERVLAELPEEQREVLILREIEDMDYRDIAAITNVPLGTVMSRLSRARAALKARWLTTEGPVK
jgi:RNA polymerase sigma-70 factor (ECF subfamily)